LCGPRGSAPRDLAADTITVVRVPADRDGLQIMSIMRDNWVTNAGHGKAKINAALAYGGVTVDNPVAIYDGSAQIAGDDCYMTWRPGTRTPGRLRVSSQ